MKALRLIVCLLLTLATGGIAGILTSEGVNDWYNTLVKPSFNPPNWIFGPVWTLLYILMGVSLWMIWEMPVSIHRQRAIRIFFIQLTLNFSWSFLFFSFGWIEVALAEIILLWFSILVMILRFRKLKPAAAYLNVPYLIWVGFATVLNAAYLALN
jgi:tryptophan-rich sensory protein